MQGRIVVSILMLSVLSLISNYHIKLVFADAYWALQGSLIGLLFMEALCCILLISSTCRGALLMLPEQGIGLKSHFYFCLGGLFLGATTGYNCSVISNTWNSLSTLRAVLMLVHCLICIGTVWTVFFVENTRGVRRIFMLLFDASITEPRLHEFISSMVVSMVLADYVGTMAIMYFGFFGCMYYIAYRIYIWKTTACYLGFAAFGIINCGCNIFRYFYYIRPKNLKEKDEDEGMERISHLEP